jgi:hypothetical protein
MWKGDAMKNATQTPLVGTVSKNMADAVSYLCSVASEAGLNSIAARLANIRATLLHIARTREPLETGSQIGERDKERDLDY